MSGHGLTVLRDGDTLRLAGPLGFANAAAAWGEVKRQLAGIRQLDLGGLAASDSAALACLLGWRAQAGMRGRNLRLVGVPAHLRALAQVSDVSRLLDGAAMPHV